MKTRIMKALGAAGAMGALTLLSLAGAASASAAPAQSAHPVTAASPRLHGFQPEAASFTTPTWGVVLGGSGRTAGHAARAELAVTADGGAHWSLMRAPRVWLDNPGFGGQQVNRVVFADRSNGWLYYQYNARVVWATHDGGASWQETTLPGDVQTMAASAHAVYAVAGNRLYHSPLGRNAWTQVRAWPWYGSMTGNTLAVSGDTVWFSNGTFLWRTADGVRWARYSLRSPGMYYGAPYELAGIAAASPRYVAFLYASPGGMFHTGMKVMISFNGGRTMWQTRQAPPPRGNVAAFAMAPGRYGVIVIGVVTPGLDNIYRSTSLGWAWTTFAIQGTSGGAMLSSLQFMSPATGCLVTRNPGTGIRGQLLWTADAGRTWYPVRF